MADLLIKCHYDKHEAETDKRVDTAQSMKMLMMCWMVILIVIIQSVEQTH
jgi:hypothetical protein